MRVAPAPAEPSARRYLGTAVLDDDAIRGACHDLLGLSPEQLDSRARAVFCPAEPGRRSAHVFVHSATSMRRSLECEDDIGRSGRPRAEISAWVEGRATALAEPGDLVVCRPGLWDPSAVRDGVAHLVVPDAEHYYLSHALLALAHRAGAAHPALRALTERLRAPDVVVRVYCMDTEMQILLLHLAAVAGVDHLRTDGNLLPQQWSSKAMLHPAVDAASRLRVSGLLDDVIEAEAAVSPLGRIVAGRCPVVPGYTLPVSATEAMARSRLVLAARLLRDRYGVRTGCLKSAAGGSGMRIRTQLELDDSRLLTMLGRDPALRREPFVLEAQVHYLQRRIAPGLCATAPSVHIRHGRLAAGATLQVMHGASWRGNVVVDDTSAAAMGLPEAAYAQIRAVAEDVRSALARSGARVMTAGLDFAVGTLDGPHGDRVIVALQDPNFLFTGAELLHDHLARVGSTGPVTAGAGLTVVPTNAGTHEVLAAVGRQMIASEAAGPHVQTLYSLPGRWALLASTAGTPTAALSALMRYRTRLAAAGLIDEPQQGVA